MRNLCITSPRNGESPCRGMRCHMQQDAARLQRDGHAGVTRVTPQFKNRGHRHFDVVSWPRLRLSAESMRQPARRRESRSGGRMDAASARGVSGVTGTAESSRRLTQRPGATPPRGRASVAPEVRGHGSGRAYGCVAGRRTAVSVPVATGRFVALLECDSWRAVPTFPLSQVAVSWAESPSRRHVCFRAVELFLIAVRRACARADRHRCRSVRRPDQQRCRRRTTLRIGPPTPPSETSAPGPTPKRTTSEPTNAGSEVSDVLRHHTGGGRGIRTHDDCHQP